MKAKLMLRHIAKPSALFRLSAIAALFALAACANPVNGPEDGYDVNTRFPISVEPEMRTLYVPVNGGITPETSAQVSLFTADYLDHGTGAMAVSAPRGSAVAGNGVADYLTQLGVPRGKILLGTDDGAPAGAPVKLTYISYRAQSAPCGDWSVNLADTASNKAPPNFGCSLQQNFAAMVADPRDLLAPEPLDPASAARRMTIIDKYVKGEPTGATKASDQSGAVADVGQK